jgi:hypothetical protein
MSVRICLFTLLLGLAACTTTVQTNPARTATEEMLISTAAERAAEKLALKLPVNANIFIDTTNFEGTDSKYAIASIRSHLLQKGAQLTDDKKKADIIVEASAGALSTDRNSFLIGIPQFNIPVPLASSPLPFPEIAIYGTDVQKGVAKFAIDSYSAKNGKMVDAQEPQYGFSHNTKKTLLFFITWTHTDYLPEGVEEQADKELEAKKAKAHLEFNANGYAPSIGTIGGSTSTTAPAAAAPASVPSILR